MFRTQASVAPTKLVALCQRSTLRSPGAARIHSSHLELATLWHAVTRLSSLPAEIPLVVATHSHRLAAFAEALGLHALLTSSQQRADVQMLSELSHDPFYPADLYVSVSAADPSIGAADVARVLRHLQDNPGADAVTLHRPGIDNDLDVPLLIDSRERLQRVLPSLVPATLAAAGGGRVVGHVPVMGYRRRTLQAWRDAHEGTVVVGDSGRAPLDWLLRMNHRVDVLQAAAVADARTSFEKLLPPNEEAANRESDLQPQMA